MGAVRLESLKLVGFKSFADEVMLTFPGSVCAILGPNGSGKSNIVDALLWVLGEQSPSILRLKNMGDVVFGGSSGRRAAGSAEVKMVLRAGDGRWTEQGGRIEIRRKVLRSGPSEYRLNGKAVRLKDIAEELASVGLGTRAYSIIEQGRIGQVLSARPTDRRVLLEEAAGLTRYKARKHDAELKLERTRQNLLRIDDVLDEVGRSLRQLKRQARQAEKYQLMQETLAEHLEKIYALDAEGVARTKDEVTRRRAQILNETAAAASALGGAEADLVAAKQRQAASREALEGLRAEISRLDASTEGLEAFLERSEDLLENLQDSVKRNGQDERGVREELRTHEGRAGELSQHVESCVEALKKGRLELGVATEKHQGIARQLEQGDSETSRLKSDLLRSISGLTSSRNRLSELEREKDRLNFSSSQLAAENSRLAERRQQIEVQHAEALKQSAETCRLSAELDEERAGLATRRNELRLNAQRFKESAEKFSDQAWEHRHRLTGIERELGRFHAALEKIAAALPEGLVLGRLSDFLSPDVGAIAELDRIWSDRLDLPVLDGQKLDEETLGLFSAWEESSRFFLAVEDEEARAWPEIEGALSLFDAAGFRDGYQGWLSRALPPAYSCDDSGTVRRLASEWPELRFIDGEQRVWSGTLVEVAAGALKLKGSLALEREKSEVLQKIEELDTQAEGAGGEYQQILQELNELEEALILLDRRCLDSEQEGARALAVEESLKREKDRLHREDEALQRERERRGLELEELEEKKSRLVEELKGKEVQAAGLESEVEEAGQSLEGLREAAAEALRKVDRARAEERLAVEREESARRQNEALKKQMLFLQGRLKTLERQRKELDQELEKTCGEIVASRTRLVEEQAQVAAVRRQEVLATEESADIASGVQSMEVELRKRRSAHDSVRELLHQVELERAEAFNQWQRLEDACGKDLGRSLAEVLERSGKPEDGDSSGLRGEAEEIRRRLDSLGPVNLLALDELKELSERQEFLSSQRKDLLEALKSLDATIAEIDATCRERFLSTFEEVNTVFGETFSYLFGGGQAGLELVDEDQPLDSGLDINAQPPGKKNQSVQLLSGGEKALTALALLIALFRIKPSPFCILDEVDAPLDDANVERLGELIRSMTSHTQFVMITHNRRTMQRSDLLYGVTMEEPGVSKVVSARLDD